MNYEMARWLLDLCSESYLSTRHMALQVEAASFIANYNLEKWDADGLRDTFASLSYGLWKFVVVCRVRSMKMIMSL